MNIPVVSVEKDAAMGELPGRRRLVDLVIAVALAAGRMIRALRRPDRSGAAVRFAIRRLVATRWGMQRDMFHWAPRNVSPRHLNRDGTAVDRATLSVLDGGGIDRLVGEFAIKVNGLFTSAGLA